MPLKCLVAPFTEKNLKKEKNLKQAEKFRKNKKPLKFVMSISSNINLGH